MKNIIWVISIIIFITIIIFSRNKIYKLIGLTLVVMILIFSIIIEFYKYYKNKVEIVDTYFNLKSEGFIYQLFIFILLFGSKFIDMLNGKNMDFKNENVFFGILMLICIVLQTYSTIFHIPKLSTNGFLCSDGKFISFNSIKSIQSETQILNGKKLIVEYDKKSEACFKVSNFDYENIENHLLRYGSISIKKIS